MLKRKVNRLQDYDYSQNGAYFVTICTKDKQCIFGEVVPVGAGVPDRPKVVLSQLGRQVEEAIQFQKTKTGLEIGGYVIMPNHIHIIMIISNDDFGRSGTPAPTISKVVGSMKSYVAKIYGNVWQKGFYDHIIRNQNDYDSILNYIDTNPDKRLEDEYYNNEVLQVLKS
ncbi:MAG: transposase [Firmicutes bacterium]|nr:transposase [Bacillota bacterium]